MKVLGATSHRYQGFSILNEKNLFAIKKFSMFIPVHGVNKSFIFLHWISVCRSRFLKKLLVVAVVGNPRLCSPFVDSLALSCPLQVTWRRQ